MINYLESLLEEQEDEESCLGLKGLEFTLPGKRFAQEDEKAGGVAEKTGTEGAGAQRTEAKETDAERAATQKTETAAEALRQSRKMPVGEMWKRGKIPSAFPAARFGGETPSPKGAWLYQQLTRGRRLLGMVERGPGQMTLTLTGEQPAAPPLSLPRLDRAFQRDARRYDSGFSLY